jgi:hypothetical protein
MLNIIMLNIVKFNVVLLNSSLPSIVMINVIVLNVIMLSVITLNVPEPSICPSMRLRVMQIQTVGTIIVNIQEMTSSKSHRTPAFHSR